MFHDQEKEEMPPVMEVRQAGDTLELKLICSFSSTEAEEFRKQVMAIPLNAATKMVVDMGEVFNITSAGIGVLIALRHHALTAHMTFRLVNVRETVKEVIRICNAGKFFGVD